MATALIDGVRFVTKLDTVGLKKARQKIEAARQINRRMMIELEACKTHASRLAAVQVILKSPEVILTCAIRANSKLPQDRRPNLEECFAIAGCLPMDQPLSEKVVVRVRFKSPGKFRTTCAFGPRHRTRQEVIAVTMARWFVPRSFQCTRGGVRPPIRTIKKRLGTQNLHVAKLDVTNCYASVDMEVLLSNELPLPKGVVDHVVLGRHLAVVVEGHVPYGAPSPHTLLQEARRGLPQGSICSPIVASFIFSRLPWTPSLDSHATNYVDDFFLISPTAEGLTAEVGELTKAMQELSGGKLHLRIVSAGQISDGAEFIGHHLQLIDGQLITSVTPSNEAYFYARWGHFESMLPEISGPPNAWVRRKARKQLARLFAFVQGWADAHRECDDLGEYVAHWVAWSADCLNRYKLSVDEVCKPKNLNSERIDGYGL